MRRNLWLIVAVVLIGLWVWSQRGMQAPQPAAPTHAPAAQSQPAARGAGRSHDETLPIASIALPPEAADTLRRIAAGGPFEHRQDGGVFQNREQRLPRQPRGYYREYTVETPRSDDRGARRIVTGGDPPSEYYYTGDHYRSFTRFDVRADGGAR
ncbi:ribonuclease domain-containing protein [Lysobacter antibioticus]|uniref:Ribonuclease n=1 Tax=Lysobacter antibioticus TaxID=84531 RepID=A0A0S2F409_LYSAN|nr:ribonuclease domain-containing protein [Lysobacter antibioticus]ALN78259.1 ribonuclease [Lysobacter antibioticus]